MIRRSFAVAVLAVAVVPLFAQTASTAPAAQAVPEPDIAIFANVRAREVRFEEVPRVTVTFAGAVNAIPNITVRDSDRTNLPDDVQPRVIYRDIGIRLVITSTLPNIEQIVDEALRLAPQNE